MKIVNELNNVKNKNGITLIALIITIIIMLILVGVVLNVTIGENGLFKTSKYAVTKTEEEKAREKLELALADLQIHKYSKIDYNENEYIDNYLSSKGMMVKQNVVVVDHWEFEIDRSVPKIVSLLGKVDAVITESKAILTAKNTTDGQLLLKVETAIPNDTIQQIEIYDEANNKVETINVPTGIQQIQKEQNIYVEFMENKTYYAKIIGGNSNLQTNTVSARNENAIASEKDLKKLANLVNNGEAFEGKNLIQVKDIELTNPHTIIGSISNPFKGTYNGQEKNISNIMINNTSLENVGLFGYVENATLMNITLGEGRIISGNKIGGIVGYAKNSNLNNLKNTGTDITANSTYLENNTNFVDDYLGTTIIESSDGDFFSTGGICGAGENINIQNCINNAQIKSTETVTLIGCGIGGIIGYSKGENVKILKCTNMGTIKDAIGLGGIVGFAINSTKIEECINKGIIEGRSYLSVGGIAGFSASKGILNCKNEESVTGLSCVSGIVGVCKSKTLSDYFEVQNCSNLGVITSTGYNNQMGINGNTTYASCGTGGIVGYGTKTKVIDCYNAETVTKQADCNDLGGIAGCLKNGEINRCYNKGVVDGNKTGYGIGGILGSGYYNIKISNSYNANDIIGFGSTGGIAGYVYQIDLRYCYNIGNVEGNWACRRNYRIYCTI